MQPSLDGIVSTHSVIHEFSVLSEFESTDSVVDPSLLQLPFGNLFEFLTIHLESEHSCHPSLSEYDLETPARSLTHVAIPYTSQSHYCIAQPDHDI